MAHVNPITTNFDLNTTPDWCFVDPYSFYFGGMSLFTSTPNLIYPVNWNYLTVNEAYLGSFVGNANANNLATYQQLAAGNSNNICSGVWQSMGQQGTSTYGGYLGCKQSQLVNFTNNSNGNSCPWFQSEYENAILKINQHVWGPTWPNITITGPFIGPQGIQYCNNPNATTSGIPGGWCKSWFYQFGRKHAKLHFIETMHEACDSCNTLVNPFTPTITVINDPNPFDPEEPIAPPRANPSRIYEEVISFAELITRSGKGRRSKKIIQDYMNSFNEKYPPSKRQINNWTSEEDDQKLIEYYRKNTDE